MVERLSKILAVLVLAGGAALTAWGIMHLQWPRALNWTEGGILRYEIFLIACAVVVIGGSFWSRRSPLYIGSAVAVVLALLSGALGPLLVALWFAGASALLGRAILAGLRINTEADNWLTSFLVGAGAYGTAVGLLAHFPVNYPGVYGVALALPFILSWRWVGEQCSMVRALVVQKISVPFRVNWLDVAIAVVALVHFVVALIPELGYDATAMHLFISSHLAQHHQWGFDAGTYVWAVMPMLGDWIFSIGYMLAGETAARLINVGFIFTLALLVRGLVLWARGTGASARWAVLLFLSTPLTFTESSSLFIESAWASFVVGGLLAILSACSSSGKPRLELPLAGLLLGCALATKAVTLTILPVLLLLLIWRHRSWSKTVSLPFLALGLVLFFVMGAIPYLTAWKLTGNPVFPFFNHIFKSPYYLISKATFGSVFNQGLKWDVLYQVTFHSDKYLEGRPGASGFQWLLLFLPASIFLITAGHRRAIALILVGVLSIAIAFQSTSYLRYVFPAFAILAAAIGLALEKMSSRFVIVKNWGHLVALVTVGLNLLFLNTGGFYGDFALESAVDATSRENYREKQLPIHSAVELVNRLNTARTPVAVFAHPRAAGLSGDALYPNWYNFAFQKKISSIKVEQDLVDILLTRGVDFIILDSAWNGVNCCTEGIEKQAIVEKATEKIAEFGSLSVRKLKPDYLFKTELLSNPDFRSTEGWVLAPEVKYDSATGVVLASVSSSLFQVAPVFPGRRYLNTVVARCAEEPTSGRVQINWLDTKGVFVRADIKTFDCSPAWAEQAMTVIAPPNAVNAVVYVVGHSAIPLEFKSNSLRQ